MDAILIRRVNGVSVMGVISLPEKEWFKGVQTVCEGFIQQAASFKGHAPRSTIDLWVNEDGFAQYNGIVTAVIDRGYGPEPLCGPIVVMATKKAGGNIREMLTVERESVSLVQANGRFPILTVKVPRAEPVRKS